MQPCFIRKNTPELIKKLEELEYKSAGGDKDKIGRDSLYCYDGKYYEVYLSKPARYYTIIDCGTNEELFLALAALRNDSDYMQWFICVKEFESAFDYFIEGDMIKCEIGKLPDSEIGYLRKATVEEIVEHFKDK